MIVYLQGFSLVIQSKGFVLRYPTRNRFLFLWWVRRSSGNTSPIGLYDSVTQKEVLQGGYWRRYGYNDPWDLGTDRKRKIILVDAWLAKEKKRPGLCRVKPWESFLLCRHCKRWERNPSGTGRGLKADSGTGTEFETWQILGRNIWKNSQIGWPLDLWTWLRSTWQLP